MSLSREEVEKVALLARLLLTDDELDRMTRQLTDILGYMALLGEVDTEGVEPMAHALDLCDVLREDRAGGSLARDDALAGAPRRDAECYLVPAVLEE